MKVDRTKVLEMCSIKRSTFDRLVTELEKHAKTLLGKFSEYFMFRNISLKNYRIKVLLKCSVVCLNVV